MLLILLLLIIIIIAVKTGGGNEETTIMQCLKKFDDHGNRVERWLSVMGNVELSNRKKMVQQIVKKHNIKSAPEFVKKMKIKQKSFLTGPQLEFSRYLQRPLNNKELNFTKEKIISKINDII